MHTKYIADIDRRVSIKDDKGQRITLRISELSNERFVVLLGEPGIGKSTVFARTAQMDGGGTQSVRNLVGFKKFDADRRLYADGFDEYRSDGNRGDKAIELALILQKAESAGWWLSCRGQDWRELSDLNTLSNATGGNAITVATLEPLEDDEAVVVLDAHGIANAPEVCRSVHAIGASPFLRSPLSIELLAKSIQSENQIPRSRFELYQTALTKMSCEHNENRTRTDRHSAASIFDAASQTCLLLLVTGAPGIWNSNGLPPSPSIDGRGWLTAQALGLDRKLLDDMLDTSIFRGAHDQFVPFHRSVAEFMGARALAAAVVARSDSRAAYPLSRALALITSPDGGPPSELRALFAWFAVHLAQLGDDQRAAEVIKRDPHTVLTYGDAALLPTNLRRALLEDCDRDDPYPLYRSVEKSALGALAGEDLASDMQAILTGNKITPKVDVVLNALENGRPVHSLRPLLRSIVLDPSRPSWLRVRSIDAWLNGVENASLAQRQLFDALDLEAKSVGREKIRVHLASVLMPELTIEELKSVLADHEQHHDRREVGLYRLQRQLVETPRPELFDEPVSTWRTRPTSLDSFDVDQLLRNTLVAAIGNTPGLSAARLYSWLTNYEVSRNRNAELFEAVREWLAVNPEREVELIDAIVNSLGPADGAWMVRTRYIDATGKLPISKIFHHVLEKAEKVTGTARQRLAEVAYHLADASEAEGYWSVLKWLKEMQYIKLADQLSRCEIEQWRLEERDRAIADNQTDKRDATGFARDVSANIEGIRTGKNIAALGRSAQRYFGYFGDRSGPDIKRLSESCGPTEVAAIVDGWASLLRTGVHNRDAATFGRQQLSNNIEYVDMVLQAAADVLLHERDAKHLPEISIVTALSLLRNAFLNENEQRSAAVVKAAIQRINDDPQQGVSAILDYWESMLDADARTLEGLWAMTQEEHNTTVIAAAVDAILERRPGMTVNALEPTLSAGVVLLEPQRLLEIAAKAIGSDIGQQQLDHWQLLRFALDPATHEDAYVQYFSDRKSAAASLWHSDFFEKCMNMEQHAVRRAAVILRLAGALGRPEERFKEDLIYTSAEIAARALNILTIPDEPAMRVLRDLLAAPELSAWHNEIRHRLAETIRSTRDLEFKHPKPEAVSDALAGRAPVNASDLRAIALEELNLYRTEIRTGATTPWKTYWGPYQDEPHTENQCRNILTFDLKNRFERYKIAALLPETLRAEDTRADLVILSGNGSNLPLEAKRHNHPDLWTAASTQLQGYASDPEADGFGIYLVFWFGTDCVPLTHRPDSAPAPTSADELESMLKADLSEELQGRTDVIVLDFSRPNARASNRPGRKPK